MREPTLSTWFYLSYWWFIYTRVGFNLDCVMQKSIRGRRFNSSLLSTGLKIPIIHRLHMLFASLINCVCDAPRLTFDLFSRIPCAPSLSENKKGTEVNRFFSSFGCVSIGTAIRERFYQNNPFFNDCIWETHTQEANQCHFFPIRISQHTHGATNAKHLISEPMAPRWNTSSISIRRSISHLTRAWPHQ